MQCDGQARLRKLKLSSASPTSPHYNAQGGARSDRASGQSRRGCMQWTWTEIRSPSVTSSFRRERPGQIRGVGIEQTSRGSRLDTWGSDSPTSGLWHVSSIPQNTDTDFGFQTLASWCRILSYCCTPRYISSQVPLVLSLPTAMPLWA